MQPDRGTCSTSTNINEAEPTGNSLISDRACQLSLICTRTAMRATGLKVRHNSVKQADGRSETEHCTDNKQAAVMLDFYGFSKLLHVFVWWVQFVTRCTGDGETTLGSS